MLQSEIEEKVLGIGELVSGEQAKVGKTMQAEDNHGGGPVTGAGTASARILETELAPETAVLKCKQFR